MITYTPEEIALKEGYSKRTGHVFSSPEETISMFRRMKPHERDRCARRLEKFIEIMTRNTRGGEAFENPDYSWMVKDYTQRLEMITQIEEERNSCQEQAPNLHQRILSLLLVHTRQDHPSPQSAHQGTSQPRKYLIRCDQ